MKKRLAILAALALVGVAGCGGSDENGDGNGGQASVKEIYESCLARADMSASECRDQATKYGRWVGELEWRGE